MKFKQTRADYKKFRKSNRIQRVKIKKKIEQDLVRRAWKLKGILDFIKDLPTIDPEQEIFWHNNPYKE